MDRIVPSESSGPGAVEAAAAVYASRRLAQLSAVAARESACRGLDMLDVLSEAMFGSSFADSSAEEQDIALRKLADIPHPAMSNALVLLVDLTLAGLLCAPCHGGNRERLGWALIGFRPHPSTKGAPEGRA